MLEKTLDSRVGPWNALDGDAPVDALQTPWVSSFTPLEPLDFLLEFGNNHIIFMMIIILAFLAKVCAVRHVLSLPHV